VDWHTAWSAIKDKPPDRSSGGYGRHRGWVDEHLGFAVAVPLGGFLAERGYWWLFALDAGTSLAFAVVVFLRVPESRPERRPDSDPGSLRDVLATSCSLHWSSVSYCKPLSTCRRLSKCRSWWPATASAPAGTDKVLGLNGVLIIVLQPLLLEILARLLLAGVLQGVGIALHGFADTLLGHMAAVLVWTIGEVLQAGLLASVVAGLAPAQLRGRYMGIFGMAFGLAALAGPLLVTPRSFIIWAKPPCGSSAPSRAAPRASGCFWSAVWPGGGATRMSPQLRHHSPRRRSPDASLSLERHGCINIRLSRVEAATRPQWVAVSLLLCPKGRKWATATSSAPSSRPTTAEAAVLVSHASTPPMPGTA
jgi:hypothetical protein